MQPFKLRRLSALCGVIVIRSIASDKRFADQTNIFATSLDREASKDKGLIVFCKGLRGCFDRNPNGYAMLAYSARSRYYHVVLKHSVIQIVSKG